MPKIGERNQNNHPCDRYHFELTEKGKSLHRTELNPLERCSPALVKDATIMTPDLTNICTVQVI